MKSRSASSQSYVTAPESPMSSASNPSNLEKSTLRYRLAKQLPFELREHCGIYLEEQLYSQAFSLLNSILVSGTSQSDLVPSVPAYIPTTQQLSLAGTLIVHPSQTTKAAPVEANRAANDALRLLRQVNSVVGPVNADFTTAFAFSASNKGRFRAWRTGIQSTNSLSCDRDHGAINTDIATTGSIWNRAEDFWHVVGWAFNCSVVWKKRWERWELWLDFIVNALDGDFEERLKRAKETEDGHDAQDLVKESLIVQYLISCGSRTARRRMMRSIFAEGNTKSMNEFKELFKNETKERKPKETSAVDRKTKKLNIDEGEFADYVDDDDDDDEIMADSGAQPIEDTPTTATDVGRRASIITIGSSSDDSEWSGSEANNGLDRFGGMDSILLRQRLLALLAKVAELTPAYFTTLEDLLDLYTEFVRPLPTSLFSIFVSPAAPYLSSYVQTCFNRTLLRPLLGLSDSGNDTTLLEQNQLENDYLPRSANSTTVSDNAKVSLLVEGLLRSFLNDGALQLTKSLQQAMEWGIEARRNCADCDARKKATGRRKEEQWNQMVLEMSTARINAVLDALIAGNMTPRDQESSPVSEITDLESAPSSAQKPYSSLG